MDITFQSLLLFVVVTIGYYTIPSIGKPWLTLDDIRDADARTNYFKRQLMSLGVYLLALLFSQMGLNIAYLMGKCGGSLDKNIGAAALYTILPWTFIFGVMMLVVSVYTNLKDAFSNVVGYFVVANAANDLFSSIFLGSELNEAISKTSDEGTRKELTKAAEAILKICGNKSVLINQINIDNFSDIWNTLKPLMKPGVYENNEIRAKLLSIVSLKDSVGEGMWFLYTAVLISSIVYYNLATRGCVKSKEQIKSERDAYLKQQDDAAEQAKLTNGTTYVAS